MSDQPESETSTLQHKTRTRDRHPCLRGELNPQTHALDRAAAGTGDGYIMRFSHTALDADTHVAPYMAVPWQASASACVF